MPIDVVSENSSVIPDSGIWSLLAFVGELLLATFIYSFKLERRKKWWAWLVLDLVVITSFSYAWSLIPNYDDKILGNTINISFSVLYFFIMFVFLNVTLFSVFKLDPLSCMFLATAGYSTQHFIYKFIQMIIGTIESLSPGFQENKWAIYGIYIGIMIVALPLFYLALGRKINKNDKINLEDRRLLILSVLLLLCTVILNLINETFVDQERMALFATECLFDMVCCFLILFIEFEMLNTKKMNEEYIRTKTLWESEKKQLEMSKENMDYIRIIAHDLKHELKASNVMSSDKVQELEHRLATFGNSIKTGSDILDLVLAERNLIMQREKINLSVIADGSILSTLSNSDCYSLFMNIMDNAIDAVKELGDGMREISLSVRETMGMISIHETNPYKGDLEFKDGLPLTTKGDTMFHGLGTKSIKKIVENYDGVYQITTSPERIYVIDIMIPMK